MTAILSAEVAMSMLLQRIGIVLSMILIAGYALAEQSPSNIAQRLYDGELSTDPAQWDDEIRKEFFANMPPEYHQRYLDTYTKLREATHAYWRTRAELFRVIHLVFDKHAEELQKQGEYKYTLTSYGNEAAKQSQEYTARYLYRTWGEFLQYPEWRDPDKQTEYWKTLAEETLFLYSKTTEELLKMTEVQKQQADELRQRIDTMALEDLPRWLSHPNFFLNTSGFSARIALPLTDEQKLRILNDEPLFRTKLVSHYGSEVLRFQSHEFLKESRDAEREPWKIDATPELAKLGITQAEVDRWDGSLSLHPLIRTIAEWCEGIDTTHLQTNISRTSMMIGFMPMGEPGKTLSNTHPALMAVINGEKNITFSARRIAQAEIDALASQNEQKWRQLPLLPTGVEVHLKPDALRTAAEAIKDELVEVPFAKDAFIFLQNRFNPARDLTLEQYQSIFSGKSTSWKDVGGFGGDIVPFIRNVESGSEELMQTLVMKDIPVHENFKPQRLNSMSVVFDELTNIPLSIAYSIYHYDRYMVFNPNTRVMAVNGMLPNAETIASGEYPLVYECVLVHRKNPGERVERFVQWLLSDEGQRLVRSVGYVPIK